MQFYMSHQRIYERINMQVNKHNNIQVNKQYTYT